eukprot:1619142-Rhodomonas_salina.2
MSLSALHTRTSSSVLGAEHTAHLSAAQRRAHTQAGAHLCMKMGTAETSVRYTDTPPKIPPSASPIAAPSMLASMLRRLVPSECTARSCAESSSAAELCCSMSSVSGSSRSLSMSARSLGSPLSASEDWLGAMSMTAYVLSTFRISSW